MKIFTPTPMFTAKRSLKCFANLCLIVALFCLGMNTANAQSFRTPTFTGALSDFNGAEQFAAAANSTTYAVTFDATYMYLGAFRTAGSFGASDNFSVYIDVDPRSTLTAGNGTTAGRAFNGFTPTLPFNADYTTITEQSYTDPLNRFNGSWASTGVTPTVFTSTTCREVRIALSDLGNPASVYLSMWMGYSGGIFSNAPGTTNEGAGATRTMTGYFGSFPVYKSGITPVSFRSQNTSTANGGGTPISDLTVTLTADNTPAFTAGDYGDITISGAFLSTVGANTSYTGTLTVGSGTTNATKFSAAGFTVFAGGRGIGGTAGALSLNGSSGTVFQAASAWTFNFLGAGSINGANITKLMPSGLTMAIGGAVDFFASGTIRTVFGTGSALQINANGTAVTNPPTYNTGSTLIYNSGVTAGLEWTTNAASGAGVPDKVTIQNNSAVNFGASGVYRQANGLVTIGSGSGLTLSSASGGDLRIAAGLTNNNAGTGVGINTNGRAVQSMGTGTYTKAGTDNLDFLIIGSANTLTLASGTNLSLTNTNATGCLQFTAVGSIFMGGTNTVTIVNAGTVGGTTAGSIGGTSPTTSILSLAGTTTWSPGGVITVSTNVGIQVNAGLTITTATRLNAGYVQINQGGFVSTNPIVYAANSTLVYNNSTGSYGVGANEWPAASGPYNVTVQGAGTGIDFGTNGIGTRTVPSTGTTGTLTLNNNINLNGAGTPTLVIAGSTGGLIANATATINGTGAFTMNSAAAMTTANVAGINGTVTTAGTKTFNTNNSFAFNATASQVTGTLLPATIGLLAINNSAGGTNGVTISNNTLTISGVTTLALGALILPTAGGNLVTFTGNISTPTGGGTIKGSSTSNIATNGTIAGTANGVTFTTGGTSLNNWTHNTVTLGSTSAGLLSVVTINGTFSLQTSGAPDFYVGPTGGLTFVSGASYTDNGANNNRILQTTTTGGTFTLQSGSNFATGNTSGLTSAGTGAIQTTNRVFNGGANYTFNNASSVQAIGDALDAAGGTGKTGVITGNVVINNNVGPSGVTLNAGTTITVNTPGTFNIGVSGTSSGILTAGATAIVNGTGNVNMFGNGATNGSTLLTANASGVNGTFPGSGILALNNVGNNNTNFTFNGTALAQATGTLLPATINNLTINNATAGTATATPAVLLSASTTVGGTLTFTAGHFSINGQTLTANGAMTLTATQRLVGTSTSNFIVGGSGAITASSLFGTTGGGALNNFTINRAATTIIAGTPVTVSGTFSLTNGALSMAANTLTLNGVITLGTGTLTTASTPLVIGGSGAISGTLISSATPHSFSGITMNRSGQTLTLGSNANVSNATGLTLTGGNIALGAFNLTSTNSAGQLGAGSATSMVVANSTGQAFNTIPTVTFINQTFPIGDGTNYSPVTLTFSANTVGGTVGARVTASAHPQNTSNGPQTNYINRYWSFTTTGLTNYTYTGTFTYVAGDIVGTQTSMKLNRYTGSAWVEDAGSAAAANVLTSTTGLTQATGLLNANDFTGRLNPAGVSYTWVGGTGGATTDYNTAANWSPAAVPTSVDNVTIADGTFACIISTGTFSVNDFTLNGTGNFQMASGTTYTINGNITTGGSGSATLDCASTMNIARTISVTVPAFNYGNLNLTGGNRVLASSGTIGVCGTFTPGGGTITNTGSTIDFNGAGSQTIPAFAYNNLTSSSTGARTLASSGTVGVAGTFTPGTNSYTITTSTVDFNGTGAQTIPAFNYNNLTISGARTTNNITLVNGGTIGIAGTFSPTASFAGGTYVYTNNTIDFNSAGAQTIPAFAFYNNLSNTNNGNRTLVGATGTITIYGTYSPSSGTITVSTSTVDFAGTAGQTIPASFYNNITNSTNTNRTLASSGTININGLFTPTTATTTITGSTIQYSGTGSYTLGSFTTNVASRQYNNLILSGSGSWSLGSGFNLGVNGNFSMTGTGTFSVCNNATANTMTVDGNFALSGSPSTFQLLTNTTNGAAATVTVTGNTTTSGTSTINLETVNNTNVSGIGIFQTTDFTTTSTSTSIINFGATTVTGNEFRVSGNFSKSGTGTFNTSSSTAATGFVFNKSGTQTFTYGGANSQYTQYVVNSGSTLQLLSNLTMGSGTVPTSTFTVNGILEMGTFVISGTTNPIFTLNSGATLRTANTAGITTAITTPGTNVYNTAANYEFNAAAAQNTNFPTTVTTMSGLTINNSSNVTLNKVVTVNGVLTFTNGLIDIATFNLTLGASATISGAGAGKYVKTSSTGVVSRTLATATALPFPVGNSGYNPVTIAQSGASDVYGVRVVDGTISALSPNDVTLTIDRRWAVTRALTANVNLTVSPISYNVGEENNATNFNAGTQAVIGLHNGTTWSQANATQASQTFTTSNTVPTSTVTALSLAMGKDQAFNTTPSISAVGGISASPNNGTATNAYVGSTVTITGTGFTGVTIVRYGGSGGTSVGAFTVVNSTTITFTATAATVGQIYVQNGGGNSTSAESLANVGYITNAGNTTWQTAGSWLGGSVPPGGANVTINNINFQVFTGGTFTAGNVTINSGAELRFTGGTLTSTNVINNGTYNINNTSGTITTTTITNNSGATLTWTAANTLNIAAGGTLTNNTGATFTRGSGTINFAGAGTIDGTAAVTLNNLILNTGGLTFTTVPTIDGIFTINNGNVNQSPIYSSNSTLFYNVTYGRYLEWGATGVGTIGTTPGYPNNVTINAGTFDMSANSGYGAAALNGTLTINNGATFAFNNFSNAFTAAGGLTIPTGGTLNMNTKTAATTITGNASITGTWNGSTSVGSAVSIGGNLTINAGGIVTRGSSDQAMTVTGNVSNAGTLTLSSAVGGDLLLAGNWTNSGTFNPASREVTFNGSAAAQTLTGATTFDYLKINNTFSTATVTLVNNITVNNQLDLTAGKLVLGANNCTIGSSATIINYTSANYVSTNSTGRLIQTVAGSNVFYPVGNSKYNPLILNNSGGTSDTYGVYVLDVTTTPAANDNTKIVNRYWNVNEGTGGGSNLIVTPQWNTSPSEENANFAAGTTNRIGVYPSGGPWTTQTAGSITAGTVANSLKMTSSAAFTNDISAGAPFAAGKDNAFLGIPPTATSFTPASQYSGGTVVISGSGFTGTTSVTFGGTGSSFVVDNDAQITATIVGGATGSVVVTNPTGSSTLTGFTFLGYITTTGASTWGTAASWLGGVVPPTGAVTTINHNLSLNATILTNPSTITINSGKTFTVTNSGLMTVNTSVTNDGTFNFGGTGSFTTPIFTNNNILNFTAAGTLNIAASGTLTNNGTFTRGTGTVNFAGIGTVNGSAVTTFYNLTINTGALTLGTGTAVDGTLRINGGNIDAGGAMPIYTSNSTLFYNATYGRFKEWDATGVGTIGTTPGYPNNVTVNTGTFTIANGSTNARAMNGLLTLNSGGSVNIDANISTLTVGNGVTVNTGGVLNYLANTGVVNITGNVTVAGQWSFSTSTGATTITGNLTNSGGSINMNTATGALNVTGDVANTTGLFTLSGSSGGDLYVAGNLSNGGTFTPNSRAVFFNGTTQSVSGSFGTTGASNSFDFVRINNGTNVTLGANVVVDNNITFNSGKITLSTFNLTMTGGATFTTPTSANYVVTNSTGQLKQVVAGTAISFPVGNSAYNPITLTNGGTSDTYGVNVLDGALPVANDVTYTVNRRWQVTEAVSGGSTLTATAQFNSGEENTNYNSGTLNYLGFYNGTTWSQVAATFAGSNPFTVSAGTYSPTNLTTGTQYFGIGRDAGLAIPPPTITSFTVSPNNGSTTSGYTGSTVTINGTNYTSVTAVTIGGIAAASFTVVSTTQITAVVPQSGASGSVSVTTSYGSASLAGFTYLGYITQTGATDWATAASWLGGAVPPTGATTTIAHNLNIITAIATPPATITVNSGVTLNVSNAAGSVTASTSVTNNGTVTFSAAGAMTTPLFTNSGTGTLSWTAAGTLTISAAGTLTNNGTFTRGTGIVTFAGAGTLNGSNAVTFNNLNIPTGSVTLTTVPTIDGTLNITAGNVSAAPVYTSNSTLQYSATYARFNEWSATGVGTIGTTAGYPNNVNIAAGTFTLLNGDAATARAMNGNLTVSAGTFTMTGKSAALTVGGNITVSSALTLGTLSGGDLYVAGNLTNNGTFTHNDRAVFFTGSTQTVAGTFNATGTTNRFAFIVINNGTNVTLGTSINVKTNVTFNSGKITLGVNDMVMTSGATFTTPTSANYVVTNSTGQLKQIVTSSAITFPVGNGAYNPLTLTNSLTSDTYGIRVVDAAPPAANAAKSIARYWAITEAVAGGSNLTPVVLQYNTGEEGGSFNAGTTPYMGLYNGIGWFSVATTLAGSNPFTATSTGSGQFPSTIPSGSYLAIGKDDAFGAAYYRSITTGNWSSLSTWESSPDNVTFSAAVVIPGSGYGTGFVTVQNGHTVTVDYVASPASLTIAAGGTVVGSDDTKQLYVGASGNGPIDILGTLTLASTIVTFSPAGWLYCGTMTVGNGGIFNNNCGNAFAPYITAINVQNGGTYNHNAVGSSANGSSVDFAGGATTRTFGATSNCNITKWAQTAGSNSPIFMPATSFGNLTINLNHTLAGGWNQQSNLTSIQGDFTLTNTGGVEFRLTTGTAVTLNLLGNLIINGGTIKLSNGAGVATVNITKGFTMSSGVYDGGSNSAPVNFINGGTGDINISGGTNSFGSTTIASGRLCNILNTSNINVVTGKTFTISGYTNIAPGAVISGAGSFVLTNSILATLGIGSVNGITTVGTASGNIQTTTARTFNGSANYVYTGVANQVTGTALPASIHTLSIANTGGGGNNVVTLTRAGTTIINSTGNPSLVLNSGVLNIGSGKNIDITSGGGIENTGSGDFDATTPANSGTITFKGTGTTTGALNIYPGVIQGPPSALGVSYSITTNIRNFLRLDNFSFVAANPPVYSTGSTLIYNSTGTYNRNAEWSTGSTGLGVPYNVTVQNNTLLDFDANNANVADRYVRGDLTLGVTGATGSLGMGNMDKTILVDGNVIIGGTTATSNLSLSTVAGGDMKVKGNWTRNSFGSFTPNGRAVYLDGPTGNQTVTATGGATFDYLIVDKATGNVILANDATVNQTLTLTNGYISTSTNKVIIASGGTVARTNGYVAGNLQKTINAAGAVTYETGATDAYRPINFTFNGVSTPGTLNALVSQSSGVYTPLTGSGLDASYVLLRNYKLTNSSLAANYDAVFNFIAGDVQSGSNTSTFVVRRTANSGSTWANSTAGTRTALSTQSTGITSFGDFVIGNSTILAVTLNPSSVTVCQGANISFTSTASATPTLNASAISVIWEVSTNGGGSWATVSNGGVYSGATTTTLTITGVTSGMFGYQYRAVFTDLNTSVTSTAATINLGSNTWTGTAGTSWTTAGNWSCGAVPLSGQDVIIPSTTNKPVLAGNVTVGAMNLQSGAFITLGSNTFAINGAVTGTGTLTGTINSNLEVNGTGTLYFTTGSNNLNNFTVNSTGTVTLGTSVNVAGILTPTLGTLALGSNNVTLLAGTNAEVGYGTRKTYPVTGIVGIVGGTIDYTGGGKFVAERYVPAKRAYRFITSQVNTTTNLRANWMENTYNAGPGYGTNNDPNPGYGTHITGSAAGGDNLDWTLTNNPSLFTYDNATQNWGAVYNSNGTLAAGYPYRLMVRGNRGINLSLNNPPASPTILRQTGTLITGNVTLGTASSTPATMPLLNGTTNNFSYIGNPYASPVNWNSVYNNSTNIQPTITIWDPVLSTRGAYAYNNTLTGITSPPASAIDDNIQPGQAFFVQTAGASPSLVINEAYKTSQFTNVWRSTSTLPKLNITLSSAVTNAPLDGVVAVFDNQFPAGLGAEDSYKFTNLDESVGIFSNNKTLSIEGRPVAMVNDSVPLRISQYRLNNYYLEVNGINFDLTLTAVVKDKYLNIETPVDLSGGNTLIPFTIINGDAASAAADRFVVLFKAATTLPLTITDVKAYQKNEGIQVDWVAQNEVSTDHYEVEKSLTGQQFEQSASVMAKHTSSNNELYGWFDMKPVAGNNYYRIKVVEKTGEIKYTRIVKVNISKAGSGISVYPNPVKGNKMNVQFANLPKGKYNVILYNNLGETIFTQSIEHNGRNANYNIGVTQLVTKGSYNLVISNKDFEQTEKLIFE